MTTEIALPEQMDSLAAPILAGTLLAARGQDLQLNGQDVAFGGALCIQVLVACARQWEADGCRFEIISPSSALRNACNILGIGSKHFGATSWSTTGGAV